MAIEWNIVQSNVGSGVVSGIGSAGFVLNSNAASSTPLTINAHASQTAKLMNMNNSSGDAVMWVTGEGKIQSTRGIRTDANPWGDGLSTWSAGHFVAEHTISNNGGEHTLT